MPDQTTEREKWIIAWLRSRASEYQDHWRRNVQQGYADAALLDLAGREALANAAEEIERGAHVRAIMAYRRSKGVDLIERLDAWSRVR